MSCPSAQRHTTAARASPSCCCWRAPATRHRRCRGRAQLGDAGHRHGWPYLHKRQLQRRAAMLLTPLASLCRRGHSGDQGRLFPRADDRGQGGLLRDLVVGAADQLRHAPRALHHTCWWLAHDSTGPFDRHLRTGALPINPTHSTHSLVQSASCQSSPQPQQTDQRCTQCAVTLSPLTDGDAGETCPQRRRARFVRICTGGKRENLQDGHHPCLRACAPALCLAGHASVAAAHSLSPNAHAAPALPCRRPAASRT